MFLPLQVDVPMARWPIANFLLIAIITVVSVASFFDALGLSTDRMVLNGWGLTGLFGHVFLHADSVHLIGNMLFLWVFGNAVCAKIGNFAYLFAFTGFGLIAAIAHNFFDGAPAIGASGAINGVVGAFLILYPLNSISCLYFIGIAVGHCTLSSGWVILCWLLYDIFGAAAGGGNVAYWAHLGGFAAGAGLCLGMLHLQWLKMRDTERSLPAVLCDRYPNLSNQLNSMRGSSQA